MQHLGDGYGFRHDLEVDPDMAVVVGVRSPITDYCRRQTPWPEPCVVIIDSPGSGGEWTRARFKAPE